MANAALALGTVAGYAKTRGYGADAGQQPQRYVHVKLLYHDKPKMTANESVGSAWSNFHIS